MSDSKKGRRRPVQNHCEFTEADRAPFFELARRFSQRLKREPKLVTDAEIHEMLGEEVAPAKVRAFACNRSAPSNSDVDAPSLRLGTQKHSKLVGDTDFPAKTTEEGKRLRKKANRALHTRLFALGRILEEVDAAIAGVIAAPGPTNRLRELEQMQQSIEAFRIAIGWPSDSAAPPSEIDPEIFRDLLLDPTWTPDDA